MLTQAGGLSEPYRAFFDDYRSKLSQDFESALIWRQLGSFRWLNSSLAATSLFEILSERLLGGVTQADLSRRQVAGDATGLVVNTTLYNNGRRLAATSLPAAAFSYDFVQALKESVARQGRQAEIPPMLVKRWELLRPMTPLEINMDPCPMRLAGMVTASASFPPLVGPITLQVRGEETYWHAEDGGLNENNGIESLLFVFLNQLQEKRARRTLILAFDSSFPFSVGDRQLSRRAEPFSLMTFDFSRIPSMVEERPHLSGAVLQHPAVRGGDPGARHGAGHPAPPHRRGVARRPLRSSRRMPRGDAAPPISRRRGGAHCRDPDAPVHRLRLRPPVTRRRRDEAGGAAPNQASRVPRPSRWAPRPAADGAVADTLEQLFLRHLHPAASAAPEPPPKGQVFWRERPRPRRPAPAGPGAKVGLPGRSPVGARSDPSVRPVERQTHVAAARMLDSDVAAAVLIPLHAHDGQAHPVEGMDRQGDGHPLGGCLTRWSVMGSWG